MAQHQSTARYRVQLELKARSGIYGTIDTSDRIGEALDKARQMQNLILVKESNLRVRTLDADRRRICPVSTETWRALPRHEKVSA